MWDGRTETRHESKCPFCDTDFFAHSMLSAASILESLDALRTPGAEWIWISGGEPLLQLDGPLANCLHQAGFKLAVETNGTCQFGSGVRESLDHVTVSPKLPYDQTVVRDADTLKLLWPHPNPDIRPENYEGIRASYRYLQPIDVMDDPIQSRLNLDGAIQRLEQLPGWRLGIQLHKIIGVE